MRILPMTLSAALVLSVAACGFDTAPKAVRAPVPPPVMIPVKPVSETAMEKLRGMAAPAGMQTARLFDSKLSDDDARLDRLEKAVQDVRNDVDAIAPTVLELHEEKAAPPVAAEAAAPATATGSVTAFRFADHADKTRVVLDLGAACDCTVKLDNKGKQLVMPLQSMEWKPKKIWDAESAKLISGYHVVNGVLYIDMMYPATIKAAQVIAPNKDSDHYRFMVDLVSPSVHK